MNVCVCIYVCVCVCWYVCVCLCVCVCVYLYVYVSVCDGRPYPFEDALLEVLGVKDTPLWVQKPHPLLP